MAMIAVAFFVVLALCGLALRANRRLRKEARLPMQWWLTGDVTWSAPRIVALTFIPALAAGVLAIYVTLALNVPPRAGQEGDVFRSLIILGATFIAVQFLHFWLIEKTLQRSGR